MKLETVAQITIFNFSLINLASTIFPGKTTSIIIVAVCIAILFALYFGQLYFFDKYKFEGKNLITIFLVASFFAFVYGFFNATNYEDYNYLFIVFVPNLLFPFIIALAANLKSLKMLVKCLIMMALPLSSIMYFTDSNFNSMYDFSGFVSFIYLLIILVPFVNLKLRIIIIAFSIVSLFYNLEDRTNVLMILMCLFEVALYYIITNIGTRTVMMISFRFQRIVLIFTPLVFLALGVSGVYNVFKTDTEDTGELSEDLTGISTTDSRTVVYLDVLNDLYTKNKLLYGVSPTGRHDSSLKSAGTNEYFFFYKNGRLGTEVGVLEYLLRGGLIYLSIFIVLIFYSANISLFKSNNDFSKLIAMYIFIYWCILFIELQPSSGMWSLSFFIAIGIALNPAIRNMSNRQIKNVLFYDIAVYKNRLSNA